MTDDKLPDLQDKGGRDMDHGGRSGLGGPGGQGAALAAVMELEVPVSIELGRTQMAIEDVLALGRGSVVQLDRLVGQPVEVYVSERPFATGEVVVTGEKFGVRILRILDSAAKQGGA
ncbi:MAG: flagellar motor switch protein FliN [Longimicrobiales bacterium]